MFQNYALFPHLTVFENVAYGLRVKRLAAGAIRERVGARARAGGAARLRAPLPEPALGRRAAAGGGGARGGGASRGCCCSTSRCRNLDAKLRVQMRAELSRLQRQLAITTIYVTHDQEEAMAISDRIAVMQRGPRGPGRHRATISTGAPRSAFVAQFIGRVNLLPARVVRAEAGAAGGGPLGREIAVPAEEPAAAGQTVSLVLRPESVALLPEGAAAPAGEVAVRGRGARAGRSWARRSSTRSRSRARLLQAVSYDPLRHGLFEWAPASRSPAPPPPPRPPRLTQPSAPSSGAGARVRARGRGRAGPP